MRDMKTVTISRRSTKILHIEGPGFIVNIHPGLRDGLDRSVTSISIMADGDRYAGEPQWWADGERGNTGTVIRIVQTNDPVPPVDNPTRKALKALLDWGRDHTSPLDQNSPHNLLVAAQAALETGQ